MKRKEIEIENSKSEEQERKKSKTNKLESESSLIQKYRNDIINNDFGELSNNMSINLNCYNSNNYYRNGFISNESIPRQELISSIQLDTDSSNYSLLLQNKNMFNPLNSENFTINNQSQSLLSTSIQDNGNLQPFNFSHINNLGVNSFLSPLGMIPQLTHNKSMINPLNYKNIVTNGPNQPLLPTSFQGYNNLHQEIYNNNIYILIIYYHINYTIHQKL